MIRQLLEVIPIALEFLELAAHREQPLLRVLGSLVGRSNILARHSLEMALHLVKLRSNRRVTLGEFVYLSLALIHQKTDLFQLFLHTG